MGFISLTGISFDLTVLAGLLTVAGYSINDKVVVFDRVREIFRSARKLGPEETINKAVNNTLSRTIITGITTFFALFSLYFLGGPVVEGFAMTVIFGIVVGTLSSIFFCNPILLWLGVSKSDLQTVRKEDPELALRP
jgi:preprotein translocase subunit SecF